MIRGPGLNAITSDHRARAIDVKAIQARTMASCIRESHEVNSTCGRTRKTHDWSTAKHDRLVGYC